MEGKKTPDSSNFWVQTATFLVNLHLPLSQEEPKDLGFLVSLLLPAKSIKTHFVKCIHFGRARHVLTSFRIPLRLHTTPTRGNGVIVAIWISTCCPSGPGAPGAPFGPCCPASPLAPWSPLAPPFPSWPCYKRGHWNSDLIVTITC